MKRLSKNIWLVFVNIKAQTGFVFNELIELDIKNIHQYKGAWANLLIKADNINEAIRIVPLGLAELNFEVIFIDKVENIASLIEQKEINNEVIEEVNWLNKSKFVFKVSDKIFPYK